MTEADVGVPVGQVSTTRVVAVRGSEIEVRADTVVGEEPMEIRAAGPGKASMECQLVMDAKGNMSMTGGVVQAVPALLVGPGELVIVASGGMTGHPDDSSALGQVGSAISDVHVVFDSGAVVRASVGNGWFTAWWPAHDMSFVVAGFDASGRKIAEVKR